MFFCYCLRPSRVEGEKEYVVKGKRIKQRRKQTCIKGPEERWKMKERHEKPGNQSEKRTERQVGMVIVLSVT